MKYKLDLLLHARMLNYLMKYDSSSLTNYKSMNPSKETIYHDWSFSKWLNTIEKVFCPLPNINLLSNPVSQCEFLDVLQENLHDFFSRFTELVFKSPKKSKAVILQLILTSNKIHLYFLNISKVSKSTGNAFSFRSSYVQILTLIECLLDDCEILNEKLLKDLPQTRFASFMGKVTLKKNLSLLKTKVNCSDVEADLAELLLNGLQSIIEKKEIKRGEVGYVLMIFAILLNMDSLTSENIENVLIQYDFNSPKFFNYIAKRCIMLTVENTSLYQQMELLISLEEQLNGIPHIGLGRLNPEDEPIQEQLRKFYQEKKESVKQRIKLRRTEILDAKLWDDNEKAMVNLAVPQMGLWMRLFMEQGIIPKEEIGKTFSYYAKHFRTPSTPFISAESLQKKSTDVEFATAKKIKTHLIGMVNWLNENYNTSNYRDS